MFKCDDTLTSYIHPFFKILFCCVLIVLIVNRRELINIDNPYFDGLLTVLSLILGILSVLRIYISCAEMFLLYERRTEAKINIKKLKKQSRNYSIEYIISLLETNDIIDILIVYKNQIIRVEASSENFPSSSKFVNKKYAIDKHFVTLEEIKEKLNTFNVNDRICVISIDDLPPTNHEDSQGTV